ncbi:MAG: CoA pyrophosphatase [Pseudomonadota bacterium]
MTALPASAIAHEALAVGAAPADDPFLTEFLWHAVHRADHALTRPDAAHADVVDPFGAPPGPQAAAVLFAVGADPDGTPAIVLTERAKHLAKHPGQVALPGGRLEAGESPVEAAVREAFEEIAMPPEAVSVIGPVGTYLTRTGFLVVPVLGVIKRPVVLRPDPSEVGAVFTAPFGHVMRLSNHREVKTLNGGVSRSYFEVVYNERRIWGVTAGLLRLIHEKLYHP